MSFEASVAEAIEDLLRGGLTTTSQATLQVLESAFQEAARQGRLRLGLAIRGTLEELRRYCEGSPEFSARRLQALQTRAWLLAKKPPEEPGKPDLRSELELVGLGVQLKRLSGDHVAIEWRLRALFDKQPLIWSSVSPHKWKEDVPLEAYLAIPLKQGFAPAVFLEGKVVKLSHCLVNDGRLSLKPESQAHIQEPFREWETLAEKPDRTVWQNYRPSPLDNETEPQQEVLLEDGTYGLLHYHRCQRIFQPLSRLTRTGPEFLNIDRGKVNPKLALKVFYKTK